MALNITGDLPKPTVGKDYGEHLGTKPITAHTSTMKTVKGKEQPSGMSETETVHPGVFTSGMTITVEGGRTINLGNFESARVGVTITVPCDQAGLNDAYEWATNWVSERIDEAMKEAKSE